jgi:hypothetical protein
MDRPENAGFAKVIQQHFPGAIPQSVFVANTATRLAQSGFTKANTLACVALCRDEIAASLLDDVERHWGSIFSLASLAGMVTAGTTGIAAAVDHAPLENGRGHFVVYAMPHIAIGADGEVGRVVRPGVPEPSNACGALTAFREELRGGALSVEIDHLDAEQSLLKHRLAPSIGYGDVPGLIALTKIATMAVEQDLRQIFSVVTDSWATVGKVIPTDAAMFTGIQIHGPSGLNLVLPRAARIELGGSISDLD